MVLPGTRRVDQRETRVALRFQIPVGETGQIAQRFQGPFLQNFVLVAQMGGQIANAHRGVPLAHDVGTAQGRHQRRQRPAGRNFRRVGVLRGEVGWGAGWDAGWVVFAWGGGSVV